MRGMLKHRESLIDQLFVDAELGFLFHEVKNNVSKINCVI